MKLLFYFESFHRLFIAQKPFLEPLEDALKTVRFFIYFKQRRDTVSQKIEQEVFRYRSLRDLAENNIKKNQSRLNIER